jgi:hypothetical protein
MRVLAILLATVLALAPLGTRAADLVVWWDAGGLPRGGPSGPRASGEMQTDDTLGPGRPLTAKAWREP